MDFSLLQRQNAGFEKFMGDLRSAIRQIQQTGDASE